MTFRKVDIATNQLMLPWWTHKVRVPHSPLPQLLLLHPSVGIDERLAL
jgi:hypothetical protein